MNKVNYQLQFENKKDENKGEWRAGKSDENRKGTKLPFSLKETDTVILQYMHLDNTKMILTKEKVAEINANGGIIKAGTHIAYSGVTGNATGTHAPHLHFGVQINGTKTRLNPALFIKLNSYDNKEQENAKKEWQPAK